MHAVGRDANNQMYPLAIAVVEAECKSSWTWFLDNLLDVIGRSEQMPWTFISDRQKGLVESFKDLMPGIEHRFCSRHMYANFRESFKGKELKDLMSAAVSSYTIQEFDENMATIKAIKPEAHNWLMKEPPQVWARCMFNSRSNCDMLSSNISESFNHWIKDARDKPIVTMMEMIRRQLVCRYEEKRKWISKCAGPLCPAIQKKLKVAKEDARHCEVTYAGGGVSI